MHLKKEREIKMFYLYYSYSGYAYYSSEKFSLVLKKFQPIFQFSLGKTFQYPQLW